jgi:hypothetical protein
MPKKLRRLKISEVSVCDAAANPHAQILIRKAVDSGAVSFRKRDTGETWTVPADIDCLPALIAAAPGWGIEILTDAAPPPVVKRGARELPASPAPTQEARKMKSKEAVEVVKRAVETGEAIPFSRDDVYAIMQKRADREIDGRTAAIRFSRYADSADGRALMQALKVAEPGPAAAPPRTSYEMLMAQRDDHVRKAQNDADDRRRAVASSINTMIEQLLAQHPGLTRDAARRRVLAMPRVQAMLRGGRPIVDRAQAG